ncbi:MAG: lamin tail domain-containing protein [bacterium]|nr:lamin tail domain-containing protein [bacterium]
MKKLIVLFLACILFTTPPLFAFGQENQTPLLSKLDTMGMLNALQLGASKELQNLRIFDFSGEGQSALSLFRSASRQDVFNFLPQFATTEGVKLVIKTANLITQLPEKTIGDFLGELEKQTVAEANKRAIAWLFSEGIKTGSGEMDTIYHSYKGLGQGKAFLQYLITYRESSPGKGTVALEFRSPEPTDAYGAFGSTGQATGFLGDSPLQGQIPPFIINIQTKIQKNGLNWEVPSSASLEINVEFPPEVPRLQLAPELPYPLEEQKISINNTLIFAKGIFDILGGVGSGALSKIGEIGSDIIDAYFNLQSFLTSFGIGAIQDFFSSKEADAPPITSTTEKPTSNQDPAPSLKTTSPDPDPSTQNQNLNSIESPEEQKDPPQEELIEEPKPEDDEAIAKSCTAGGQQAQLNTVIINEIAWMGTQNSSSDEWVEIKNRSNASVNLGGWGLLDKDEQIQIAFTTKHILPPNGFLLLERTDDTSVPEIAADLIYTGALSNQNESLFLFDNNCVLRDSISANPNWPAGKSSERKTMERTPSLTWQTSQDSGGTPKRENSQGEVVTVSVASSGSGSSSSSSSAQAEETQYPALLMSELQALPIGERFIELYNPNEEAVDLAEWYIQRKTQSGALSSLVSSPNLTGKSISARGYFLITRSTSSFSSQADLLLDITLTEHNFVLLKNPNGSVADSVGFGANAPEFNTSPAQFPGSGKSLSRIWNGTYQDTNNDSEDFSVQDPTPGTHNTQTGTGSEDEEAPSVAFVPLSESLPTTKFTLEWETPDIDINTFSLTHTVSPSQNGIFLKYWENDSWVSWGQGGTNALIFDSAISAVSLTAQDGLEYLFSITAKDAAENESSPDTTSTIVSLLKTIVINEVAWAGTTAANTADEWLELFNASNSEVDLSGWSIFGADTDACINFAGAESFDPGGNNAAFHIWPGEYLVYGNSSETVRSDSGASLVDVRDATIGLNNESPGQLLLYDQSDCAGNTVDAVNQPSDWFAGDNQQYRSMERIDSAKGANSSNWASNNLITHNGFAADGTTFINGTPGNENSVSKSFTSFTSLRLDEFDSIALTALGSPYSTDVLHTIPENKTLSVKPGVTVTFGQNGGLDIEGQLTSAGQEENRITLTSVNPPTLWKGISFTSTSTNSEISWTTISYAKRGTGEAPSISIQGSSPTIQNSTIEHYDCTDCRGIKLAQSDAVFENLILNGGLPGNSTVGIDVESGNPQIKNSSFTNNRIGLFLDPLSEGSLPTVEGNTFEDNDIPITSTSPHPVFKNNTGTGDGILIGGAVTQQTTLFKNVLPYVIGLNGITINAATSLTIQDGVVLKMKPGSSLDVNGALLSQGTSVNPIIITSLQATPSPGNWKWIRFNSQSAGSTLSNTLVEYGGSGSEDKGMIIIEDSSVTINNLTARQSSKAALYLGNSNSTVQNSSFTDSLFGLKVYGPSCPSLSGNSFENNTNSDVFTDSSCENP